MIHSFRLRLALLSALIAGLALLAFGLGTWWMIRNIKIERIDSEVRTSAEREIIRARTNPDWQREESRLTSALGIRDSTDLLLLVQDGDGEVLYRSPHWPASMDASQLHWPEHSTLSVRGASLSLINTAYAQTAPEPRYDRPPPDWRFRHDGPSPRPNRLRGNETEQERPPFGNIPRHPRMELPAAPPPTSPQPRIEPPPPASGVTLQTVDGQQWRIGLARTPNFSVAVAVNSRVIEADMKGIRNAFLIAMPLSLGLIGLGGWVFSGRALRPLNKLNAAIRRVTAEGLNQRISAKDEDNEFVELIEVYNRMLERLERSFKQAHRFSADAAHELRTPLAILQGQLERAISHVEDGSPIQAELTGVLDEVRRLSTISRKLLLLSQADAGRLSVHRTPFDLSSTLGNLVEDTRMLAPHLQVSGEIHSGLSIAADGSLLLQVLHNLISNAIKYNIDQGWISITTFLRPQWIDVQVANSSPGIPAADRGKLFERFFRADPAHGRNIEGVGLGLSVSREIARAHGGDITFSIGKDNSVQFVLSLPHLVPK